MKFINFLNKAKYFVIFLIIGLLIFFYPSVKTGFDNVTGGYDSLYFNYVMEHSYLWIKGLHSSFWGAPFNYYDVNSIAQGDSLFAILPLYWITRIFAHNPLNANQIVFFILCILNYSLFYFLLKNLRMKSLSSSFGAFVFAFSTLRFFNLDNIASFSQFLSIIAILFLIKTKKNNTSIVNHFYFLGCSVFVILQFYTCFALGFFGVFCAIFALIFSLLPKNSRDIVIDYLKYFYKYILFYVFIICMALLPMAYHFSCLEYYSSLDNILIKTTDISVWFRSLSILDSFAKIKFDFIGGDSHFCAMSLGIITMTASLYGLFKTPKVKGVSILTFIFIVLISSGYSAFYFWKIFYIYSLGLESLDAIYPISFVALFIVSLGVALFSERVKNKFILIPVLVLILLEQISYNNDLNSLHRVNFLSKKDFINSVESLKVADDYIKVSYKGINQKEFGKNDIIIKNYNAQKYADLHALWLGIRENKPVINNYFKKSKPQKEYNAKEIDLIIDYNQI